MTKYISESSTGSGVKSDFVDFLVWRMQTQCQVTSNHQTQLNNSGLQAATVYTYRRHLL